MRAPKSQSPNISPIALAIHGKRRDFDNVIERAGDRVQDLKTEKVEDDGKKECCKIVTAISKKIVWKTLELMTGVLGLGNATLAAQAMPRRRGRAPHR